MQKNLLPVVSFSGNMDNFEFGDELAKQLQQKNYCKRKNEKSVFGFVNFEGLKGVLNIPSEFYIHFRVLNALIGVLE